MRGATARVADRRDAPLVDRWSHAVVFASDSLLRLEEYLNNLAFLQETYRSAHGRYTSDIWPLTSDPWSVHIPLTVNAVETGWSARLTIRDVPTLCYIAVGTAPPSVPGSHQVAQNSTPAEPMLWPAKAAGFSRKLAPLL